MMWTTVASSTRFRLLPLLIVMEDCVKLVLFICTSVLPPPPPEPPHATTRTVTRLSTTKPIINFFIELFLSFFGKKCDRAYKSSYAVFMEVTSLYIGNPYQYIRISVYPPHIL